MIFEKFASLIPSQEKVKSRIDGDFLLVMSTDHELFYLNDTARFIYECFDGKKTISKILDLLMKEYEIESNMKEAISGDLVETIRNFQWQNIIRLKEAQNENL